MNNPETYDISISFTEIFLFIIMIVCMRGCYHCSRIADKVAPEQQERKDPYGNPYILGPNGPLLFNQE